MRWLKGNVSVMVWSLGFVLIALVGIAFFPTGERKVVRSEELEALSGLISAARTRDSVLHVKGSLTNRKNSSRLPDADTVASHFEFWWSLKDPDHFRIEMKPRYSRWTNASHDYYEESYSFASDGSKQVRIDFSGGGIGHASPRNYGIINRLEWDKVRDYLLLTGADVFPPLLQIGEAGRNYPFEDRIKAGEVSTLPIAGSLGWEVTLRQPRRCEEKLLFSQDFKRLERREVTYYSGNGNLSTAFAYRVAEFAALEGSGFDYPKKIEVVFSTRTGVERIIDIAIDSAELISDKGTLSSEFRSGVQILDKTSWKQWLFQRFQGN